MLKRSLRSLSVLVITVMILVSLSVGTMAASDIRVEINGKTVDLNGAEPYMNGSVVMLPMRAVCEALGGNLSWDSENSNITLLRGDNIAIMKQGRSVVYINGRAFNLNTSSTARNGSTYIPQDYIQTVFGVNAVYNSASSLFSINLKTLPVYFSDSFRIEYLDNGCKLLTDGDNQRLLLVPQGTTAPEGVKADRVISIPLKKVLAASTTQVGPLMDLGVLDSLKAVTTPQDSWYIPEVKAAMEEGKVQYVGGDNMGQPDYELVKLIDPDMAFVYTGAYGQQAIMEKLDEMGIDYSVNNEYLESHYLGRMEWIKFMGAFYDRELEAEKILNDAVKYIDDVTAKVAGADRPKVVWGNTYSGTVYVPDPGSYIGKWIDMAGGDYVFKNIEAGGSSSSQISMEEFYAKAKDADILIYSSMANYMQNPSIEGIVEENPLFADMKAVKNGNVWCYSPDWYETIPQTHLFVEDIASVFHPDVFEGHKIAKLVKLPVK